MVCVSCIVIPLFLYIWHRFLQPIFLKFWNPWAKVEDKTSVGSESGVSGLKCPIAAGGATHQPQATQGEVSSKKAD